MLQALELLDPQVQRVFQTLLRDAEDANLHSALAGMSLSTHQP